MINEEGGASTHIETNTEAIDKAADCLKHEELGSVEN